jgi:hypothetical protein
MPIYRIAAYKRNKNILTLTVCYDGRIAISTIYGSTHTSTLDESKLLTPTASVRRKHLASDIHPSESDIGKAMTIVGKEHHRAVLKLS